MKARVMRDFRTPMRRFRAGQLVDETEVDGPLDIYKLIDLGFLRPGEVILPTDEFAPENQ
jgi:hypothetical protein